MILRSNILMGKEEFLDYFMNELRKEIEPFLSKKDTEYNHIIVSQRVAGEHIKHIIESMYL